MPDRPRTTESPSLKEVLQDPIGLFLKRHPVKVARVVYGMPSRTSLRASTLRAD
ncbi:MAG: hypothetical protein Q7N87_02495 [Candidatus Uhrbacteria bacterium]|nr:hypothetical protein [Candidatus Uhrbacteria bacterium]